jgi:hypothetical protein
MWPSDNVTGMYWWSVGSNLGQDTDYPDILCGFSQRLEDSATAVPFIFVQIIHSPSAIMQHDTACATQIIK